MKAASIITTYRRLRGQPLWRLLAADNGPVIITLLQIHFIDAERSIPASLFFDRLNRDLKALDAEGITLPQTAQGYIADWLSAGYLERRFPLGATEEEYEISAAAASAIRIVSNLIERKTVATESRLAVVMQQLTHLAEETDTNPETRLALLQAEKERIDHEIEAIQQGRLRSLSEYQSLERLQEIVTLADDLVQDFHQVRDQFESLNRSLREHIIDNDGSRGEVLNALFNGVDLIAESPAGRTFTAFWRLLTDPAQSAVLDQAIDDVLSRDFSEKIPLREKRFLLNLTRILLAQGGTVHEIIQHFARSLKHFVQSREYLEQRRINQLLREASAIPSYL